MVGTQEIDKRPFEERAAQVQRWIDNYASEGFFRLLHPEVLHSVLSELGADFENLDEEGRRSLAHYSNRGKHVGMEQVWGAKRAEFRTWCEKWVKDYEKDTGRKLPKIVFKDEETGERRPSQTEGMRQFFGEITAYAAGCMDFPSLARRLGARHYNFGRPKDKSEEEGGRRRITIPGYNLDEEGKEKPFAPASIPPEFPPDAWDKMRSWKEWPG
jgi:hypothetical protein